MLAACKCRACKRVAAFHFQGHREIFQVARHSPRKKTSPFLELLRYPRLGDTAVLVDSDELLTIAEEYANSRH